MKKKKHKIKVEKPKFCKPSIKAVFVPLNCSLADADKIESIFKTVKRAGWSTSDDVVYRFYVYCEECPEDPQIAPRGTWIVRLYDPMMDETKFVVLTNAEYKRTFRAKK